MKNILITTLLISLFSCSTQNKKLSSSEEDTLKLLYSMLYTGNGECFYRKEINQIIKTSTGESKFIAEGLHHMRFGRTNEATDNFLKISEYSPNYYSMIQSFYNSLRKSQKPSKYAIDKLAIAIFESPYRDKHDFNINDSVLSLEEHYLKMLKGNSQKYRDFKDWIKKNSKRQSEEINNEVDEKTGLPLEDPLYSRWSQKGLVFACWRYNGKSAVYHGALFKNGKHIKGTKIGDVYKADFGNLIWRGSYSVISKPITSTGWLFIFSFSGPEFIRDSHTHKK